MGGFTPKGMIHIFACDLGRSKFSPESGYNGSWIFHYYTLIDPVNELFTMVVSN
jgi:hypothetical protein